MAGVLDPAVSIFSSGASSVLKYWWVGAIILVLGIIAAILFWVSKFKKKNSQWSHTLKVGLEQSDGSIDPKYKSFKMRRWKHKEEKTAPLFEMAKPLIGSRIFVELEEYSGPTEYTVILGKDGRLYLPIKTIMNKDKGALEVSVKHAGIDRARQDYNTKFEQMNETPKKIDVITLMKLGIYTTLIIVLLILGIQGLKAWGERAPLESQRAQLELQVWEKMGEVMETVDATANTQALMLPDLKEIYGNNIRGAIQNRKNELNRS